LLDKINSDTTIENLRKIEDNNNQIIENFNKEKEDFFMKNNEINKIKIDLENKLAIALEKLEDKNNINKINENEKEKEKEKEKEIDFICIFCKNKQNSSVPEFPINTNGI